VEQTTATFLSRHKTAQQAVGILFLCRLPKSCNSVIDITYEQQQLLKKDLWSSKFCYWNETLKTQLYDLVV